MSDRPALRIVRGNPTDEELAAVVAVLAAATAAPSTSDTPVRRTGGWADRGRLVRQQLAPSPGAWRASALPR